MRTPDAEHPSRTPELKVAARIEEMTEGWAGGVIRAVEWSGNPDADAEAA